MPRCTRKGCGREFEQDGTDGCVYHAGAPVSLDRSRRVPPGCRQSWQVFHEGLKSWSCCSDVNKPVLEFDEFMKLPVCRLFI